MVAHRSIYRTRQNTIDVSLWSADVEGMRLMDGPVLVGSQHQRRRGAGSDPPGDRGHDVGEH
jgi:hypothetical protein